MPLSFTMAGHAKALPSVLLLLAGLALLWRHAATARSYRHAWPVIVVCLLALVYPALNILGHGLGWKQFDRPAHILLYLATAAVFSLPLRMRWIWFGFSLTAILLGTVCIVQHDVLGIARAYGLNGGGWGAIEFAMVLLVLSLLAWIRVLFASSNRLEQGLHVVGAVFAMYGALLTQSRGPLLSFALLLLLLLLFYARRTRHWRRALLLLGAIIAGSVLAGASVDAVVLHRLAAVGPEVATYNHRDDARGAVRERLEMWRTAGHAFLAHPLAGVGIDQFGVYARRQIAAGHANPVIVKYDHPHNEYLGAAATGGIPGLLVLLLTFGVPLGYFARHVHHEGEAVITAALAGLAVVGMYALCALTDNVFYRVMPHSLYFFLVPGLAVLAARLTTQQQVVHHA
ncbi:MAG: O-antigen ligase family protein [Xanthomonadaceae bacterium]|nr:O-antigen ligase family protein [Xanthomonadaceae bacterium]